MKKFYLGALGCLMAVGAGAQKIEQVGTLQQWNAEFSLSIPEAFAIKGKNAPFSVGETEDGGLQINVYNKSFAVERTITVDAPTNYRRVEVEKRKAVANSTERTADCIEHHSDYGSDYSDKGYRTYFAEYCCENTTYTDEYVYEWLEYMRDEYRGTDSGWEYASIIEKREVDGGSLFVIWYNSSTEFGGFYFKDNQLSDYSSYNNEVQIQEGLYNESYYSFYNMANIEFSQEYITRYINYVGDDGYDLTSGWYRFDYYQVDSVFTTPNGETHFYTNLKTGIDGKSYPRYYFVWKDESITAHYVEYTTTYTGEWVKETQESEYGFDLYDMMMYPWTIGQCTEFEDVFFFATQTLFNNDEKWEFIRPVYKEVVNDDSWETREEDRDGDGEIDYKSVSYSNQTTGYEIVSENGAVLATIAVAENDYCTPLVIQWDDDVFFGINISNRIETESEYDYVYEEHMMIYSIDKSTTTVNNMAATPAMRVSPTLVNRNSTVNVTLGSKTDGGELIITDSNGRAIARCLVEAGQTTVPVTTDRMTSGVYNITLTEKGQKVENARIIVK